MTLTRFALPIFCVLFSLTAFGQSPRVTKEEANQAVDDFKSSCDDISKKHGIASVKLSAAYDQEIAKYRDDLIQKLRVILDTETKTGNLDSALEIRNAIKFYENHDPRRPAPTQNASIAQNQIRDLKGQIKALEIKLDEYRLKGFSSDEFANVVTHYVEQNAKTLIIGRFTFTSDPPSGQHILEIVDNGNFSIENESGQWRFNNDKITLTFANRASGSATINFIDQNQLVGSNTHESGATWKWHLVRQRQ